jgi:hypothetical protein
VYPVFVDPTFSATPSARNSYKSSGAQYVGQLHVGNTRESNKNVYWRAIASFNYAGLPAGKFIHTAQVGVGRVSGATTAQAGRVRHSSGSCYTCIGADVAGYTLSTGWADTTGWGVSQRIASGHRPVWMISGSEGSAYSHKRVDADFWVTYYDYASPSFAAGSPADGAVATTLTPTLKMSSTNPTGQPQAYHFRITTEQNGGQLVYQSPESTSLQTIVPEGTLKPNTKYYWRAYTRGGWDGHLGQSTLRSTGARSFTTKDVALPAFAGGAPGNPVTESPQTITTLTPQMRVDKVAGAAGVGMMYEFSVGTGGDGKSGAVVTSGWVTPGTDGVARWQVPAGSLNDGGLYTWTVHSKDAAGEVNRFGWTRQFKTDLRLGSDGPSPFDAAGPVTVNLANGNANLSFASPTVNTVGGPMGMSFAYNSQEVTHANLGLTGQYYLAPKKPDGSAAVLPADFTFQESNLRLVRNDPSVRFEWLGDSPADAIPADQFMARWSGYLTLPESLREGGSGSSKPIRFGIRRDDGAKLWVGNEPPAAPLIDAWTTSAVTVTWTPTAKSYSMSALPFQLEYFERSGHAISQLWYEVDGVQKQVPPDWFSKKVPTLPAGWSASAPIAGDATRWVSAKVTESAVVLTELGGTTYMYQRRGAGGFTPPAGSYGVVSLDGQGRVVFTDEDGTVHQFTKEGRLETTTSPADAGKPAAPVIARDARGVVTSVTDPAPGGRQVTFTYQNSAQTACPERAGAGFAKAPVDMLCVIDYPDTTQTRLFYNTDRHLAAIEDPGAELTLFGYPEQGLLGLVRDSIANDVLPISDVPAAQDPASTRIVYGTHDGRVTVSSVTFPAGDGATGTRLGREYVYDTPQQGSTRVLVTGASELTSHAEYDAAWRQTAEVSA